MSKLLLGKPCADAIYDEIRRSLQGANAVLCTIGTQDERWVQYTDMLRRSAESCGVELRSVMAQQGVDPKQFCAVVDSASCDPDVCGVIVQQPLPKQYAEATNFVAVGKDVDCLNPLSVAAMFGAKQGFRPATPLAVVRLLQFYDVPLAGKHVVVVGRGSVGKPLALLLLEQDATVTVCHSKTVGLDRLCRSADIVVSACGVPSLITEQFVTSDSVVVDVGLSVVEGVSCGDVSRDVYDICRAVAPVPRGVGAVTRAVLLQNLLKAYNNK